MMPLVDPHRASSQAETDFVVPRTSLSHRLAKVSQAEADRTKATDGKNYDNAAWANCGGRLRKMNTREEAICDGIKWERFIGYPSSYREDMDVRQDDNYTRASCSILFGCQVCSNEAMNKCNEL
ncbi:hypothetical protein E2C01_041288 [Portunus trituberculatus]|uniref:Uncharacterized protein n=1 Tax=Portunus trituberculatus TaxID=210409 RepID=A0A5B7FQJ5_PORTR|nr:hypothetical protein [Portunus trituberculatus]